MYYINLFFFFSFIGLIFENIITLITKWDFQNNFMFGPWIPIYGIGIFVILAVNQFLKKRYLTRFLEVTLFFITVTILITFLEFVGGHFIYLIIKRPFWDYSWAKYNFGKYICLEVSFIWGLSASLINYIIYPKLKKYIKMIPFNLTFALTVGFILDLILTIIKK